MAVVCYEKRFATAAARAALLRAMLTRGETTSGEAVLLLTRWGWTKQFRSLGEVEAALDRMSGR